MAFDYEQAKSQYGAGRAREMESEANKPAPTTPAAPSTADLTKTTQQLTGGQQPAYNSSQNNNYQNYQNYQPPQTGYQTPQNPTGSAAQKYFNSFSAADQANIKNSWGGKDLMNDWYSNAQKAGATGEQGQAAPTAGKPDGKNWNWQVDPNAAQRAYQAAGSPAGVSDVNAWFKNAVEAGAYLQNGESSSATAYNKSGYSQSGGADITGMRAWAKQHSMSEDFDRWDDGQLMAWEKQKDTGCPPNTPYRAYDGSGCVEKPIDSNKGGGAGSGAGGGGGQGRAGGAGGYGAGGAGGEQQGDLALYTVKKQYADALADPSGQKAWELYAGQGGQKTFQAEMDRYRQQIAGMPQGPARQAAEQKMREVESSMRLDMPQQARTQALNGLQGIIQPELGYVGSERDRALNKLLGVGGLENQRYGMNLNYNLGSRGLDLQGQNQMWNQNTYFPWQAGNEAAQLANQRWNTEYQGQQQNAANAGATTGAMLQQGADYFMSDIRMKENIVPGRRGLSDLMKLRSYSYNYKNKPERTQSIMAQDVEKVAPEFVKEFDGIKMVDSYGLLGMTMKAVQDLAKKMENR